MAHQLSRSAILGPPGAPICSSGKRQFATEAEASRMCTPGVCPAPGVREGLPVQITAGATGALVVLLATLLDNSRNPTVQGAAAILLGTVGACSGLTSIVHPVLLRRWTPWFHTLWGWRAPRGEE